MTKSAVQIDSAIVRCHPPRAVCRARANFRGNRTAEFGRYTNYIWRAIEEDVQRSIDAELEKI